MISGFAAGEVAPGKLINPRTQVLKVKELPPVQWQEGPDNDVRERAEEAFKKGPDALEALSKELAAEVKDKEGRYNSVAFFDVISGDGAPVNGKPRLSYGMKVSEEWRKRYPESKAPVLAQARICSALGFFAGRSGLGAESMDENWKVAAEIMDRSLGLLDECRDALKKDPVWYATYFMLIVKMDVKQEEFQKVADELALNIPDDGYALSRAAKYLFPGFRGESGEWSAWLKKQVEKYPAEQRAKVYARAIFEIGATDGFDNAGPCFMWQAPIDRGLMAAGIEALEKEYPENVYIHSAGAASYAFLLEDRQGAFDSLKRIRCVLHHDFFYTKISYDNAVSFLAEVPWDLNKVGGIPIVNRNYGKDAAFVKMMEATAEKGPRALEKLIQELRAPEGLRDQDGLYQSVKFFEWFGEKTLSLADEKRRIMKEDVLKKWSREYPASPFAKLAWASFWKTHAWNARSGEVSSQVGGVQWKGFNDRLKKARNYLNDCRELQESEPAWSVVVLGVMLGEGAEREELDAVAEVVFGKFPECDPAIGATSMIFLPRWGGKSGEWEPWLKERLKDLPEDERCMAYANAFIAIGGYATSTQAGSKEVLNGKDPDKVMLLNGLRLLAKKFPDSPRIINAQAFYFGKYTEEDDLIWQALQRMNGTIDMRVWYRYSAYDPCARHIARVRTEAALKAQH